MYPPYEYEMITQRRDELWRLADEARRSGRAARKRSREDRAAKTPAKSLRAAVGSALVRAGRAIGGDDALRPAAREC